MDSQFETVCPVREKQTGSFSTAAFRNFTFCDSPHPAKDVKEKQLEEFATYLVSPRSILLRGQVCAQYTPSLLFQQHALAPAATDVR